MSDQPEREPNQGAPVGLLIAGGLAIGLLTAALLPRGTGRKLAKGAMAAAATGSEAGMALARQAREKAVAGVESASETADAVRRRTAKVGESAASSGLELMRTAINLLGSLRR
jgi:hypothetical protein